MWRNSPRFTNRFFCSQASIRPRQIQPIKKAASSRFDKYSNASLREGFKNQTLQFLDLKTLVHVSGQSTRPGDVNEILLQRICENFEYTPNDSLVEVVKFFKNMKGRHDQRRLEACVQNFLYELYRRIPDMIPRDIIAVLNGLIFSFPGIRTHPCLYEILKLFDVKQLERFTDRDISSLVLLLKKCGQPTKEVDALKYNIIDNCVQNFFKNRNINFHKKFDEDLPSNSWGMTISLDRHHSQWKVISIEKNKQADKLGVKIGWKINGTNGTLVDQSNFQSIRQKIASKEGQNIIFNEVLPGESICYFLYSISNFVFYKDFYQKCCNELQILLNNRLEWENEIVNESKENLEQRNLKRENYQLWPKQNSDSASILLESCARVQFYPEILSQFIDHPELLNNGKSIMNAHSFALLNISSPEIFDKAFTYANNYADFVEQPQIYETYLLIKNSESLHCNISLEKNLIDRLKLLYQKEHYPIPDKELQRKNIDLSKYNDIKYNYFTPEGILIDIACVDENDNKVAIYFFDIAGRQMLKPRQKLTHREEVRRILLKKLGWEVVLMKNYKTK